MRLKGDEKTALKCRVITVHLDNKLFTLAQRLVSDPDTIVHHCEFLFLNNYSTFIVFTFALFYSAVSS